MSLAALGVALVLLSPVGPADQGPRPEPPRPGLFWTEADALEGTIGRLERRYREGRRASRRTVVVTEVQLDSYLNLTLGPRIPEGVSEVNVEIARDLVSARAVVDLDRVRGRLPASGPAAVLALLRGPVPLELQGRLPSAVGTARLEVLEVRVGGVGLPPSMLAELVALATRTQRRPQGLDILAPFALPWGALRVRLEQGRALLDFPP